LLFVHPRVSVCARRCLGPNPPPCTQRLTESTDRAAALTARLDAQSRLALTAASRSHADEAARLSALTALRPPRTRPRSRASTSAGGSPATGSPPHVRQAHTALPAAPSHQGHHGTHAHAHAHAHRRGGGGGGGAAGAVAGGTSGGGGGGHGGAKRLPPTVGYSPPSTSSRSSGGERRLVLNGARGHSPPPASPPASPSSDWDGGGGVPPPPAPPAPPPLDVVGRALGSGAGGHGVPSALLWGDAPPPGVARRRLSAGPTRAGGRGGNGWGPF